MKIIDGHAHIGYIGGWADVGITEEQLIAQMDQYGIEIPEPEPVKVFIAVMGDEAKKFGIKLIRDLRNNGVKAEMDTLARNIKGQFKYADRLGAQYTIVIGENELAEGVVSVKEMATSTQTQVKLEDLIEELTK